jgi:hypothetical protein
VGTDLLIFSSKNQACSDGIQDQPAFGKKGRSPWTSIPGNGLGLAEDRAFFDSDWHGILKKA